MSPDPTLLRTPPTGYIPVLLPPAVSRAVSGFPFVHRWYSATGTPSRAARTQNISSALATGAKTAVEKPRTFQSYATFGLAGDRHSGERSRYSVRRPRYTLPNPEVCRYICTQERKNRACDEARVQFNYVRTRRTQGVKSPPSQSWSRCVAERPRSCDSELTSWPVHSGRRNTADEHRIVYARQTKGPRPTREAN
jgi:hypothetical protein